VLSNFKLAMYRKLLAAGVGFIVLLVNKYLGAHIGLAEGQTKEIADWVIMGLTLFGIYQLPNATQEDAQQSHLTDQAG